MNKYYSVFISVFLICLLSVSSFSMMTSDEIAEYNKNPKSIIIKFSGDTKPIQLTTSKSLLNSGFKKLDDINRRYNVKSISYLISQNSASQSAQKFKDVCVVNIQENSDWLALVNEYKSLPNVEYGEPDYMAQLHASPNDPLYLYQWHLNNTGQEHYHVLRTYGSYNDSLIMTEGLFDADINAEEVYQNPPDNTVTTVVAVIDTGADMVHPDLEQNIWTNPGEIPDNGIDDDHNGYIDDVHGWDFAASLDPLEPGDNDPTDYVGHGTHAAGIIAAVTDNNLGIAGVATNCKIMPLNFDPLPLVSRIAGAILYAADNGADCISMSFGLNFRSDLIEEACNYARSKGVVLFASSGNDGIAVDVFPASYESVISVGATNDSDHVATYSSFGENLSLVAPGSSILSLRAGNTDIYGSSYPYEPKLHIIDTLYYLMSGTSMACPNAAGVAAQLRSISPGLTPERVKYIMESTAKDIIDPYGVGWNLPGPDLHSGNGRIDLYQAVQNLPGIRTRIVSPQRNEIVLGVVDISGIADGTEFVNYDLNFGAGDVPSNWTELISSATPVTDNILTGWNTAGLNGRYSLRLKSGDYNIDQISFFVINDTVAQITSPSDGEIIANFAAITANAYIPEFVNYLIEYKADTSENWTELNSSFIPIFDEKAASWYLEDIPAGDYSLKLTVYSSDGPIAADSIMIHLQSIFDTESAWRVELGNYPVIIPNYGDFDNDGQNEIIIGTATGIKSYNPDGTEKTEGMPFFPRNNYWVPPAVGNIDGDGIDDIIALGYDPPILYGYPSNGESFEVYVGLFPPIGNYSQTEHEFSKVFLKDIDNDSLDEIHVFIYNRSLTETFLYEEDGTFINSFKYYSEYQPADLNGDHLDEIYVSSRGFGLLKQIDPYTGASIDSLIIEMEGSNFNVAGLSGFDIDNDSLAELIVFGYYADFGYWLYAFDDGLNLFEGWPHNLYIDDYVVPTMPIFGDINGDSVPEYMTTFFDISASYVLVWNLDGSSYFPNFPNGFFAASPEPSVMNMLLLADMNNDGQTDIISCADNDMFNTFQAQRIYAWDNEAQLLPGFPIITVPDGNTSDRFTPSIGDINRDDNVDMIMTTPDDAAIFVNFPGNSYNYAKSPAPFWRYNRKMNNIGPLPGDDITTPVNEIIYNNLLPDQFGLAQNYPNPFNPSTSIYYNLPKAADVAINIYNLLGQKVKTLINLHQRAGQYQIIWDGTNDRGGKISSGIYFYRMETEEFSQTRKMLLLK
ncbi:MAG: S8 family serine peptidase [Candidatus Zixiibacteriota bacterium]